MMVLLAAEPTCTQACLWPSMEAKAGMKTKAQQDKLCAAEVQGNCAIEGLSKLPPLHRGL